MECWKFTYLPWKTITLLKSRSMVCCLLTEDNWFHFLQWNDSRWILPGISYEFHFPFGGWWTRLLVAARWGKGAYSKFNNVDVEQVLWWLHYFSKLVAPPQSPDLSPPDFYLWGFLKENVYKNNSHTLEELKQNTELCISNVTAETLQQVASNMRKKNECMHRYRGGHFQHLI
jgi:hypothetical protein